MLDLGVIKCLSPVLRGCGARAPHARDGGSKWYLRAPAASIAEGHCPCTALEKPKTSLFRRSWCSEPGPREAAGQGERGRPSQGI